MTTQQTPTQESHWQRKKPGLLRLLWCVILLTAFLIAIGYLGYRWWIIRNPPAFSIEGNNTPSVAISKRAEQIEALKRQIDSLVDQTEQANLEAADHCIAQIHQAFERYRSGVPHLVEDLMSLRTRLRVAAGMVRDTLSNQGNVQRLMQGKFQQYVLSEAVLQKDIHDSLQQFREAIWANQQELLSSVKAAVESIDPSFGLPSAEQFHKDLFGRLAPVLVDEAHASVYQFVAAFVASEIAANVGTRLVASLLNRLLLSFGTRIAATAAAVGGTTPAGAAAGGTGGSMAGPIGTAAGVAVGLAIGIAVDWWLSNQQEAYLTATLNEHIRQIELQLIEGSPAGASVDGQEHPGLRAALYELCRQLKAAQKARFQETLAR